MSFYGTHWEIDGIPAAFISRGLENGRYQILFEREFAELPQIETINWEQPVIRHLADRPNEQGLPEGYGFEVIKTTYNSNLCSYTVEVQVAKQYLGDVSGYQVQIDTLTQTVADQEAMIQAQSQASATLDDSMESAYMEGVESNG